MKFISDLPKELRPPAGARFTVAEGKRAYEAIAASMTDQFVSLPNCKFTYVGEDSSDATLIASPFSLYGVTWNLRASGTASAETREKLRTRRSGSLTFSAKATKVTASPITKMDANGSTLEACTFNVVLTDITIR